MTAAIDASTLKAWLSDGSEIALLDVREHGQYGAGHPFFAVPLPYSRFEVGLPALVPNPAVRLVLCDDGDGVAVRAAGRADGLGYRNVHVLTAGVRAWQDAGYTLFRGVNVPSKTFGELVEHARCTPRMPAPALQAMRERGDKLAIIDGRPLAEYRKMNIPGGICCPNGELALRIKDLVPDAETTIVVNCAGRTRSIIGAQTLIDLGIANPVYALENGTQGWFLAGLPLEHGASRRYDERWQPEDITALQTRARKLARARGVAWVDPATAQAWLADSSRTTYLLDVRTAEEFAARHLRGFLHAPGGQLIQATDQWVGVKGARLVLVDDEIVRAPIVAGWLRQLGHEACVLAGGVAAGETWAWTRAAAPPDLRDLPLVAANEVARGLADGAIQVIDLRPSMTYRAGHMPQAIWSIRPRITAEAPAKPTKPIVLVADEVPTAALAARDLGEVGFDDLRLLAGGYPAWRDAGLPVVATPHDPADADCIDFLFFVHDRHDGNADAAREYLAWETGLLNQLDAQERGSFHVATSL
jgi:rhodanese-related sulfurtransferase